MRPIYLSTASVPDPSALARRRHVLVFHHVCRTSLTGFLSRRIEISGVVRRRSRSCGAQAGCVWSVRVRIDKARMTTTEAMRCDTKTMRWYRDVCCDAKTGRRNLCFKVATDGSCFACGMWDVEEQSYSQEPITPIHVSPNALPVPGSRVCGRVSTVMQQRCNRKSQRASVTTRGREQITDLRKAHDAESGWCLIES
jgi:hypothetical protein